jgi:hypothetical protein
MTVFSPFCAPRRWRALPRPNLITSPGANAILEGRDCLGGSRPDESCLGGRRFVTDGQNNAFLSTFGGIALGPLGPSPTRVSTFKLYVDGVPIVSKNLSYTVSYRR